MIHNKETRVQEERGRDDSLGRRVHCSPYETGLFLSKEKESGKDDTPQQSHAHNQLRNNDS